MANKTKSKDAAERVFAQYELEASEQFAQTFEVGGLTTLPRQHIIRRMPDGHSRKYFTMHNNEPVLATGISAVVSLIKKQHGGYDFIAKYREDIGSEAAEQILTETSALGTFMHVLCAEIADIWARKDPDYYINFGENFKKKSLALLAENGVPRSKQSEYFKRIIKGAQSFYSFLVDYKVEVKAIEYCVVDFSNNICTPLDIVAYIQEPIVPTSAAAKKGACVEYKERELVNIQLKFREKASDYPTDHIQSLLELHMFNKYTAEIYGKMARSIILLPKSHVSAKIGCNVVSAGGFGIEELLADIEYAKSKHNNKDIFYPDLTKKITSMGGIKISGAGIEYETPRTISDFIRSYYDPKGIIDGIPIIF